MTGSPCGHDRRPHVAATQAASRWFIIRAVHHERRSEPMTADDFRKLALELPDAVEGGHMGHPDFRVGGKIFATLGPDGDWAMVKLTPFEQESAMRKEPEIFSPGPGAWGARGATVVQLRAAKK